MALVVVEGIDASGKSTLLENARIQISRRYFVLMRHSCRPLQLSHAIQFMRTLRYGCDIGLDIIADRHPLISEPIYGPILRGEHLFQDHFIYGEPEGRNQYLRHNVGRIIYCRPPDHVIEANLGNRPQLEGIKEKIWDLLDKYDHRMTELSENGIPVFLYDYTTHTGPLVELFFGGQS